MNFLLKGWLDSGSRCARCARLGRNDEENKKPNGIPAGACPVEKRGGDDEKKRPPLPPRKCAAPALS